MTRYFIRDSMWRPTHGSDVTPPSAITNVWTVPSAHGYPDATNTGPPSGTVFTTITGDYTIDTPGTYQNLKVLGALTIASSDVTLKNSLISPPTPKYRALYIPYGGGYSNVVIDHCEINGNSTVDASTPGINGDGYTATWCNIHSTGDGIDVGSDCTITNNYIHDLVVATGDHSDGIQSAGGSGYVVQHNTIDARGTGVNSALIWGADLGDISDTTITDNLLAGGGFTVYLGSEGTWGVGTLNFTANRFMRDSYAFGPASVDLNGAAGTINFTDNVYDNDGTEVSA